MNDTKIYYTEKDMDKLIFIPVPKLLPYVDKYRNLSNDAKWLYVICIDLIKMSISNHGKKDKYGKRMNWKDEKGFYINLSLLKIQELLNCKKDKAIKIKKELEEYNLIEQKRNGLKSANSIYVLQVQYTEEDIYLVNDIAESYVTEADFLQEKEAEKSSVSTEVEKTDFKNSEKTSSRSRKNRVQEVDKNDTINTKLINTKPIKNSSSSSSETFASIEDVDKELKEQFPHITNEQFEHEKRKVLNDKKATIKNINQYRGLLKYRLENFNEEGEITFPEHQPPKTKKSYQPKKQSKEVVPDWFPSRNEPKEEQASVNIDRRIELRLNMAKDDTDYTLEQVIRDIATDTNLSYEQAEHHYKQYLEKQTVKS